MSGEQVGGGKPNPEGTTSSTPENVTDQQPQVAPNSDPQASQEQQSQQDPAAQQTPETQQDDTEAKLLTTFEQLEALEKRREAAVAETAALMAELQNLQQQLADQSKKSPLPETPESPEASETSEAPTTAQAPDLEASKAANPETEPSQNDQPPLSESPEAPGTSESPEDAEPAQSPDPADFNPNPLVAMSVDLSQELREEALDVAARAVDEEVAQKGFITRLWKGTLFNKYYKRRYARELLSGDRTVAYQGENITLAEKLERERGNVVVQRFVFGAVEGAHAIHEHAGEHNREADAVTTARLKQAIKDYATADVDPDDPEALQRITNQFRNDVDFQRAAARDGGQPFDAALANNYLEVAKTARQAVAHGIAIDRVMSGFKAYEGTSRSRIRSAEHLNHLDKALNWLEDHNLVVPAQAIAAGVGLASALTQTGARLVGGVGAGIAVSSVLSGAKAYNRATSDRQTMLRSAAQGLEYSGTAESSSDSESSDDSEQSDGFANKRARRTRKYEAKIGGTVYEMVRATDLRRNLDQARESGDRQALLQAIAAARVRLDFTDQTDKDLLAYSSPDKVGQEALDLDIALIRAEKSLPSEDAENLSKLQDRIKQAITREVEQRDTDFNSVRRRIAIQKGLKTGISAAATFVISQEAVAALDPHRIGLLERAGILKTHNAADASQTLLAEAVAGPRSRVVDSQELRGDQVVERDFYKEHGYIETEIQPASTSIESVTRDVPLAEASGQVQAHVQYANNGTRVSDGNELRLFGHGDTSLVSGLRGVSTLPGGRQINFDQVASEGRLRGLVTLGDGRQFLVEPRLNAAGQYVFGDGNGVYTLIKPDGTPVGTSAFGNGFRTFSTGVVDSVNADGTVNFISAATAGGRGNFSGTVRQLVPSAVVHPAVYVLNKAEAVAAAPTLGVFAPETASQGLGATRPRQAAEPASGQ